MIKRANTRGRASAVAAFCGAVFLSGLSLVGCGSRGSGNLSAGERQQFVNGPDKKGPTPEQQAELSRKMAESAKKVQEDSAKPGGGGGWVPPTNR